MSRKPRLLMVSANAFPVMGGTETHIHEVAPRVAAAGFDVTVLATDRSRQLPKRETDSGVAVRRVRAWPSKRDYYFAPALYSIIRDEPWDLVHCQGYHTLVPVAAMLAAVRRHIPYVLTFHSGGHGSVLRTRLRGSQLAAIRPLLARASRLIAVSEWERTEMSRRLRFDTARFAMIPNGAAMPTRPSTTEPDEGGTLIVSVGRLERYKGHQHAIAALPHIIDKRPDARLRIVGSGDYEAALRRVARDLHVEDRVEIAGIDARDRTGMASLLQSAQLVVLLSEYEAQGIAAYEALSLGRRLVVADTTALHELADRGWAVAVPLNSNPSEMARVMLVHLDSKPPEDVDLPTWERCSELLVDLYCDVLGSRPRTKG